MPEWLCDVIVPVNTASTCALLITVRYPTLAWFPHPYAVFQFDIWVVVGIPYPAVREKTPVPLVYVRPVAVEENSPLIVEDVPT